MSHELASWYLNAKETVLAAGFADEIDLQEDRCLSRVTESDLLRETAWVILNSGFREATVRKVFCGVSAAFLDWRSAREIAFHSDRCRANAFRHFGSSRKIDAIADVCVEVAQIGLATILRDVRDFGVPSLRRFLYIGSVTCRHLAKNLGIEVCKPDRHLVRMANEWGADSPDSLCTKIKSIVAERLDVIDSVLWRYAVISE